MAVATQEAACTKKCRRKPLRPGHAAGGAWPRVVLCAPFQAVCVWHGGVIFPFAAAEVQAMSMFVNIFETRT